MSAIDILSRSFRDLGRRPRISSAPLCGVYLLVHGDEINYVGVSVNIAARLGAHQLKRHDRVLWMPVPKKTFRDYEGALIRHLRPRHNTLTPKNRGNDAEILYGLGLRDTLTEEEVSWQEVA